MEHESAKSRRGEKSTKQKAEWSNDCQSSLNCIVFRDRIKPRTEENEENSREAKEAERKRVSLWSSKELKAEEAKNPRS